MSVFRCRSCGGTYSDVLPDGMGYYHVCPPVVNPAYQPDRAKPRYDPRPVVNSHDARNENIVRLVGGHTESGQDTVTPIESEGTGRDKLG